MQSYGVSMQSVLGDMMGRLDWFNLSNCCNYMRVIARFVLPQST